MQVFHQINFDRERSLQNLRSEIREHVILEEIYVILYFIIRHIISIIEEPCTHTRPFTVEVCWRYVLVEQIYTIFVMYFLDFLIPRVVALWECHTKYRIIARRCYWIFGWSASRKHEKACCCYI